LDAPCVGRVIVKDGRILGRDGNRTIGANDPTAHAEILAIGAACTAVANYRLPDTTLYVTIEPCPMCMGAAIWARIPRIVFGAKDPKAGACGSVVDLTHVKGMNHSVRVKEGVLERESAAKIQTFFKTIRNRSRHN